MTLIAGIKCPDGFVIAADTAVTVEEFVYHGAKLFRYSGPKDNPYNLVIGVSGYLEHGIMAIEQIRDQVAGLSNPTLTEVKSIVANVIADIYLRIIAPRWASEGVANSPHFSLILAIEIASKFLVLQTADETIREIDNYAFSGTGDIAAHNWAERFLRSPLNEAIGTKAACAVHLTIELFREAKKSSSGVGLDTTIIAWRRPESYPDFFNPSVDGNKTAFVSIQQNLRTAIEAVFDRTMEESWIETALANLRAQVMNMAAHTRAAPKENSSQLVSYRIDPETDTWRMTNLSNLVADQPQSVP